MDSAGSLETSLLLGPEDVPPVLEKNAAGRSPFLLTSDHYGRLLPKKLGDLGLPDSERARHYKAALATLNDEERMLVVGRIELGFNYDQLALISGRATPEAARQAVRRAVKKLAERMPRARGHR